MSTTTTNSTGSTLTRTPGRAVHLLTWAAQVGLALLIGGGGAAKLFGDPAMVTMFDDIGVGQWLRFVTGTLELLGAVGLLVPRVRALAAACLAALLVCAACTNVLVLDAAPILPLVLAVVAAAIAVVRRRELRSVLSGR